MLIRRLEEGDDEQIEALSHLFDGPANIGATNRFLTKEDHHILVGYEEALPVGFVTGVEVTHPDKGTEMFLYELAVDEQFRRNGFGRALVQSLEQLARERGCYGMWVLTDEHNEAALATYAHSGGNAERGQVVVVWTF